MSPRHDALGADESAAGAVTRAQGFSACGFTAGIKESGLPDLAMLVSDRPATAAAVFTPESDHGGTGSYQQGTLVRWHAACSRGQLGKRELCHR